MLIAAKNIFKIKKLKAQLGSEFEMHLNAAKKKMDMEIHKD